MWLLDFGVWGFRVLVFKIFVCVVVLFLLFGFRDYGFEGLEILKSGFLGCRVVV